MSEERPAFYALSPGGWRDWWTLLHPPYTIWHLSYVALGAATSPRVDLFLLGLSILGFFLGVGIAAHALDELRGRPLGTAISTAVLVTVATAALAGAAAVGLVGVVRVSPWLLVFIAVGVFLVVAYNLELAGGAFHSDMWFALAWGAFPALTAAFAQDGRVTWAALLVAAACAAISGAQRALSTPVRRLRRRVAAVEGTFTMRDGTTEAVDADVVRAAPEAALKLLSLAMPLLAAGAVLARVLR
ncbi:MAG TPA: hypothetical protein VE800_06295 [Actinomycetota bacterium]|nr:hypothetical protein [Actinomycetota bacterium]